MSNPYTVANSEAQESARQSLFDFALVTDVESHTTGEDENKHLIECEPVGKTTTVTAQMTVAQKGDVNLPTADGNTYVILGRFTSDRPIVLDVLYINENAVPSYEPGERRIGHPLTDSNITYDVNGNITITTDSGESVTAGGGDIAIENSAGSKVVVTGNSVVIHPGGGTVKLGDESGIYKQVARKGDPVSGTTSDGATFSGDIDSGSSNVESS